MLGLSFDKRCGLVEFRERLVERPHFHITTAPQIVNLRAVLEYRRGLFEFLQGFKNPLLLENPVGFAEMLDELLAAFFRQVEKGLLVRKQRFLGGTRFLVAGAGSFWAASGVIRTNSEKRAVAFMGSGFRRTLTGKFANRKPSFTRSFTPECRPSAITRPPQSQTYK